MTLINYENQFYTSPNDVLEQENNWIHENITRKCTGKHCLDFGCGTGYWSNILDSCGMSVVGVDVSSEAIEYCRNTISSCTFQNIQIGVLPFKDNTFDIITIMWVFQEMIDTHDIINSIKEIRRVLRKNGRVIVVDNIYPDNRELIKKNEISHTFQNDGDKDKMVFFPNNTLEQVFLPQQFKRYCYEQKFWSFYEEYVLDSASIEM